MCAAPSPLPALRARDRDGFSRLPKRDSLGLHEITFRGKRAPSKEPHLKQELTVETRDGDKVAILTPIGFINAHTVETFDGALRSVLDRGRYEVVINARSLAYVASAGLGALVGTIEEIREHGGDLRICELSESVAAIFEMVGLPHLFRIFKTEEEAISSFMA
jgi:anti-sigma B factor antagonist